MLSSKSSSSSCAIWRFKIDRTVLYVLLVLGLCAMLGGLSLVYSPARSTSIFTNQTQAQSHATFNQTVIGANGTTSDPLLDDHPIIEDHDQDAKHNRHTDKKSKHNHNKQPVDDNKKAVDDHADHNHDGEVIERKFDAAHGHVHEEVKLTPEAAAAKKIKDAETAKVLEECREIGKKYSIEQGSSWGSAPIDVQKYWKSINCDTLIGVADYSKYLEAHPELTATITVDPARKGPLLNQKLNQSIAICVCTTTRGIRNITLPNLSLFSQLVPSIVNTVEPGFEYWLYIAYDKGDAFFDNIDNLKQVREFLQINMVDPIQAKYPTEVHIGFQLEAFENTLRKPGPVFNYLTHLSYLDQATYIYRINDDSSFSNFWANELTNELLSFGLPYGVVGPLCREGNTGILTHDLVHRIHHEIFNLFHYPPSLTDWWMDDWITQVYGRKRVKRIDTVIVKHAITSHGTRYAVDYSHAKLLEAEIENGRLLIEKWMIEHDIDQSIIKSYQQDTFHFRL